MTFNFKFRFFAPLTLALALLLGSFITSVYLMEKKELSHLLEKKLESMQELLKRQLDSDAEFLDTAIDMLSVTPQLQAAWLSRDRAALLKLTLPLLEESRTRHRISHFSFHDVKRVNFLRVYDPEKHGDLIDHFTLRKAEKSGKTSVGMEVGELGTISLRVVRPWRINGRLAGYLETGEEIEQIVKKLHKILGVELYVTIYKKFTIREIWESRMRFLGREGNWNQLPSSVIISKTLNEVPESLLNIQKGHHDHHEYLSVPSDHELSIGDRIYRVGFIPLYDSGKREVGDLVVLYDVTARLTTTRNHVLSVIAICVIAGCLLYLFFPKDPSLFQTEGWAEIISTPFQLVLVMSVSIFVAEALVMLFLSSIPMPLSTLTKMFIDAASLVVLVSPALYFFLFRPLLGHIVKRKYTEKQIKKSLKEKEILLQEIRHKNEELENFTYSVSHDLKTPLISIQGFSTLLKNEQKGELSEESGFYLERISKNIEQMNQLINNLLQLSQVSRKNEELVTIDTEKTIKEIKKNFKPQLNHNNIQLTIADQLPTVICKCSRILEVFNNLISNAIKFSRDIPNPTIEISLEKIKGYHQFKVMDNGIGIEKAYHDKVFGMFQRVNSEIEGTGLGLAIVKKIVERWEGKIWLESEPGKETAFYFTVPDNTVKESPGWTNGSLI